MSDEQSLLGKKVFFLYPPSVVRDDLITQLLENEFEIYMLKDHEAARRLLRKFPDSIIFVNIDEGMLEAAWEAWMRAILAAPETAGVGIGIVTYNNDEALQRKYLMDVGIRCGFVRLKLGIEQSAKILLDTLTANEAKGRRKYVRANCANDSLSTVNMNYAGAQVLGTVKDISVVGFSCAFTPDPRIARNSLLEDVQLKLRGVLVKVEGIVFGTRGSDSTEYVVLFTNKVDGAARSKIRRYIQLALQSEIELVGRS